MAKGYWVVQADVTDPEGYKEYVTANAPALRKYNGRFLARGGRSEVQEGSFLPRVVVVEFPSFDAALACYKSPEYQHAVTFRKNRAVFNLTVLDGFEGPQPTD